MMKYLMNGIESADAVDGPVVIEGGRGPSTLSTGQGAPPAGGGTTSGPLAPGQRWSAARKREVVLRPMRGESAELRSEEHTSELQSRQYLVCRLLLEKKKHNLRRCLLIS